MLAEKLTRANVRYDAYNSNTGVAVIMRAVVIVGTHHAGKSKTINEYVKPKLRIRKRQHKFWLSGRTGAVLSQSREEAAGQHGFILSQSLEEAGQGNYVADFVRRYSRFQLLVLAARPSNEIPSCLPRLRLELRSAGFKVNVVNVISGQPERYYKDIAEQVLEYLSRR